MIVLTKKPRQARVSFSWILYLHNESWAGQFIQFKLCKISGDGKCGISSTFPPVAVRETTCLSGTSSLWRTRRTNPAFPAISLLSTPTCWPRTQTSGSERSLTSSSPAPQDPSVQVTSSLSLLAHQLARLFVSLQRDEIAVGSKKPL